MMNLVTFIDEDNNRSYELNVYVKVAATNWKQKYCKKKGFNNNGGVLIKVLI